jgi:hypothetical protein
MWPHREEKFSIFSPKILNFKKNFLLAFEELCIRVLRIVVRLVAIGGSTVVKHPTHQPKVEGLSPAVAAAGTGSG